jgi:hypothetical protein
MRLRRSVETNGNVAPEGINILEAIPEQFLFHSYHEASSKIALQNFA